MTILDQIIARKKIEVKERKALYQYPVLERSLYFQKKPKSLKTELLKTGTAGIIAEFKRKSPSRGPINEKAQVGEICSAYFEAGASAISVLTDNYYFGGSVKDIAEIRPDINCPILRKDFIVDEYQIIEARSIGADAILLIAEVHKPQRLKDLFRFARSLELEVLVEIHDEKNISTIPSDTGLIGINSRNLNSFCVDSDHLLKLIHLLPLNTIKIAESGIKSVNDYFILRNAGFNGFLIGEYFMSTADPGKTCREFIGEIRQSSVILRNIFKD